MEVGKRYKATSCGASPSATCPSLFALMLLLMKKSTVLDHPFIRLVGSVWRASECLSVGLGFKCYMRVTAYKSRLDKVRR